MKTILECWSVSFIEIIIFNIFFYKEIELKILFCNNSFLISGKGKTKLITTALSLWKYCCIKNLKLSKTGESKLFTYLRNNKAKKNNIFVKSFF